MDGRFIIVLHCDQYFLGDTSLKKFLANDVVSYFWSIESNQDLPVGHVTDLVSLQRLVDQLNRIESGEVRQATCFSFVGSDRMCIGKETFSIDRKCAPHVKSWAIKYNPFLHHNIVIRGSFTATNVAGWPI